MLPVAALNVAIYHLEMEAVNFLVSSGMVDPNQEAPVPVKKINNMPQGNDNSKAPLYPTDEENIFLYGPVPKHRELHAAELLQPRLPHSLVQYMLSKLPNTEAAKTAKTALRFMRKWLKPTQFETNEDGISSFTLLPLSLLLLNEDKKSSPRIMREADYCVNITNLSGFFFVNADLKYAWLPLLNLSFVGSFNFLIDFQLIDFQLIDFLCLQARV